MGKIFFGVLLIISLLFYGVIISLSLVPVNPYLVNRTLYVAFILYGTIFYVLGTAVHLIPLLVCGSVFDVPRHAARKYWLFVLPVLMGLYMVYVIIYGG